PTPPEPWASHASPALRSTLAHVRSSGDEFFRDLRRGIARLVHNRNHPALCALAVIAPEWTASTFATLAHPFSAWARFCRLPLTGLARHASEPWQLSLKRRSASTAVHHSGRTTACRTFVAPVANSSTASS